LAEITSSLLIPSLPPAIQSRGVAMDPAKGGTVLRLFRIRGRFVTQEWS